ncbi:MAG: type II toxin-antitoxin system VapC family toxin [Chloroflexota bacterium]
MYLLDTNVWLERLLDQTKSEEVGNLLSHIPSDRLFITDFAFHSIGVMLSRLGRSEALLQFVRDAFVHGMVSLVHLEPEDVEKMTKVIQQFNLDFDDAYQYVAAEKYGLEIISYDTDFDCTEKGRKTPAQVEA